MFEISGLDQLTRQLEQAQEAFASIDGTLGTITYNPHDPASIEQAIQAVYQLLDERLGPYAENPFVAPLIEEAKEKYREGILERAAAARLEGSSGDG